MPEKRTCEECGAELPADAPEGLCPRCLVRMGLHLVAADATTQHISSSTGFREPVPHGTKIRYFGDYELLEEIARGGMGVVYRARQVSLNRVVAIKMLLFGGFASDEFVRRFRAEAESVGRMNHPNIVAIHEIGEHAGQHYFSMEYIEGRDLAKEASEGPIATKQAAQYVKTVARAVQYAHERGIVHRDLKPSNILIDGDDEPHVTDFGLAKRLQGDSDLTLTGQVLGTPAYAAPEQAAGKRQETGPASDVYSLGAILYFLVCGRAPFVGETLEDTLQQVLKVEPVAPRVLNSRLPRDLETICLKCLAKDPRERYDSAALLADDLDRWLSGRPVSARPAGFAEKSLRWCRRNPKVATLSSLVVLLLLVVTVGSSLTAYRFQRANRQIKDAKDEATEKLWGSYLAEAKALSRTGLSGQRFASLEILAKAARIHPTIEVRNELISCLTLSDVRMKKQAKFHRTSSESQICYDAKIERYAVNEGGEGCVTVYNESDDSEFAVLKSAGFSVDRIGGFSPDGRYLAVGYSDPDRNNLTCVWDIQRREMVIMPVRGFVSSGAFSGTNNLYALSNPDGAVSIYSLSAGSLLTNLPIGKEFGALVFGHDSTRFVGLQSGHQNVEIRDTRTGELFGSPRAPDVIYSMNISPDGRYFAAGCNDFRAHIWDAQDIHELATTGAHFDLVVGVAFNHTGTLLATSSWEGILRLWDVVSGQLIVCIPGGGDRVQFSPDDRLLTDTGGLGLLEVAQSRELRRFGSPVLQRSLGVPVFVAEGRVIMAAAVDRVRFWDVLSGSEVASYRPRSSTETVLFDPNGKRLITSGQLGIYTRALKSASGSSAYALGKPKLVDGTSGFRQSCLSSNGRFLAAAHFDGDQGLVYDLESGSSPVRLQEHSQVDKISISPDGKWAATSSWHNHLVKIWNAQSGNGVATLEMPSRAAATFSPDGRWLAAWSTEYQLYAVGSWLKRGPPVVGNQIANFNSLVFSPDSQYMAILKPGLGIRLLETDSARVLADLEAPDSGRITAMTFSPDGSQLAVVQGGDQLRVWDLRLIRSELRRANLDWELPQFAPSRLPEDRSPASISVEADPYFYEKLAQNIPPREAATGPNMLDLSRYFNASLTETRHDDEGNDLSELPRGIQRFAGVEFEIRGLILLGGNGHAGGQFPLEVKDIALGRKCREIHFLHAAIDATDAEDGTRIGDYIVHYENGRRIEIPIIKGESLSDWFTQPREKANTFTIAWTGRNDRSRRTDTTIRLFKSTWSNPFPTEKLTTLDFTCNPPGAPFLVAVSFD
jgi:serine/threonine protein kinase/WD40 repeat protein